LSIRISPVVYPAPETCKLQAAMPELPELEALRLTLGPRLEGALVTACEVEPRRAHLLRYAVENFAQELPYRRFAGTWRRGKHLGFDLELARGGDLRSLIVNPMLGGRFQLAGADQRRPSQLVFALRLEGGRELRYFDLRDMGRIYWTASPGTDVPAWKELGPEADAVASMGLEEFRKRLRRYRDELKDLLRNQAFLAGIGNAYSDEVLFEAALLPLRRRASLSAEEEERLYAAIPAVLGRATEAILANPDYDESKQDRAFMKVHAKGGKECPRCGHRISQLGSNREPLNFCRGCQH
jgi:formamidopyrimidine-DNA glycosylase